jgi:hypothetical protein
MDGMQIVGLVIFLVGLVAVDVLAVRGGFDSRYSWDSPEYEHHRVWRGFARVK